MKKIGLIPVPGWWDPDEGHFTERRKAFLRHTPKCQVCNIKDASYDSPVNGGSWGYLCESCFKKYGDPVAATKLAISGTKQRLV